MHAILLVDDSPSVLALLENALVEAGYCVLCAIDGRQALRMLKVQQIDLIVTDIYMPETDGLELILALKEIPQPPAVIAMSSMTGDLNVLPMAKIFGAKTILQKPFPPSELVECARRLLDVPALVSQHR